MQCNGEITVSVMAVGEGHRVRLNFSHGEEGEPIGRASAFDMDSVGRELMLEDGEA